MSRQRRDLIIIGAGPYGLAAAAYARHKGLDTILLGEPMGYWRHHMPAGMLLRSGPEWHLDPLEVHTLQQYLAQRAIEPAAVTPLPVEVFLDYASWFQAEKGIVAQPDFVRELRKQGDDFEVVLERGEALLAKRVLALPGFHPFVNRPESLLSLLPRGRCSHTSELGSFASLQNKRCLIIGGRQSAFEWATLLCERAGATVHLVYRHKTPRFERSDWTWIEDMLHATERQRGWFRRLPPSQQTAIRDRFWAAGRLALEGWLEPRIQAAKVTLWPQSVVKQCAVQSTGELQVELGHGPRLAIDHVILATGYGVDLARVPYLAASALLPQIELADGYPVLDEGFAASVPGLYFGGLVSMRDFGPFFGFVRGSTVAARVLLDGL